MICEDSGKPATQLAHRINQSKKNIKKWGETAIHHPKNLVPVCGLKCNSSVSIGNHTVEQKKLLSEIYIANGEILFEEYA